MASTSLVVGKCFFRGHGTSVHGWQLHVHRQQNDWKMIMHLPARVKNKPHYLYPQHVPSNISKGILLLVHMISLLCAAVLWSCQSKSAKLNFFLIQTFWFATVGKIKLIIVYTWLSFFTNVSPQMVMQVSFVWRTYWLPGMVRQCPDVSHAFKYHDAPSVSKHDAPFVEYWCKKILNYDTPF